MRNWLTLWFCALCLLSARATSSTTTTFEIHLDPSYDLCTASAITICPTINGEADDVTFTWSDGSRNECLTTSPDADLEIRLTAVNAQGQSATAESLIRVHEQPRTSAGPDVQVFKGQRIILTASGAYSFVWSTGESNASIQVTPTQSMTYRVTATSHMGCTDIDDVLVEVREMASISQWVWEDMNANGQIDDGEPGLNGVVVNLYEDVDANGLPDGGIIRSILSHTDASSGRAGWFHFTDIPPSTYVVQFIRPIGFKSVEAHVGIDDTNSDAHAITGFSPTIQVGSGQEINSITAGYYRPARIEVLTFEDVKGEGLLESSDLALPDVTVQLMDVNGHFVLNADGLPVYPERTSDNGSCAFGHIKPGQYTLRFSAPEGYTFTRYGAGTSAEQPTMDDSDVLDSQGATHVFEVRSGQVVHGVDAGLYRPAIIRSSTWDDASGDGVMDVHESKMNGVKVYLFDCDHPGTAIDSTVTSTDPTSDEDGFFEFSGVRPADYYVYFITPDSYVVAPPNIGTNDSLDSDIIHRFGTGTTDSICLASGSVLTSLAAGFYRSATIGDQIWVDQPTGVPSTFDPKDRPAPDVRIQLFDATTDELLQSTYSDRRGKYRFESLPIGSYYLQVDAGAGYTFADPYAGDDDTDSDVMDPIRRTTDFIEVGVGDEIFNIDIGLVPIVSTAPPAAVNTSQTSAGTYRMTAGVSSVSGDDQRMDLSDFHVYPNPATEFIEITTSDVTIIRVVDIQGRPVFEKHTNGLDRLRLDIRSWPAGSYAIYTIHKDKRQHVQRLIKTNR